MTCAPNKILLAMPTLDGRIWAQTMMAVIEVMSVSGGLIVPYWHIGDSNISHCRSAIAHYFLRRTDADTLFFLDTDIVFTGRDFAYMLEGDEPIVIAPYARKIMGAPPTGYGMGFCRIHKSVFDALEKLTDEDGAEALGRFMLDGQVATHYFYTGASADARWFGEDTGFWHMCALAELKVRYERRTRLGHVGSYVYGCPEQVPGHVVPYSGPGPYPEDPVPEPESPG
jgi:hypothetical protein